MLDVVGTPIGTMQSLLGHSAPEPAFVAVALERLSDMGLKPKLFVEPSR